MTLSAVNFQKKSWSKSFKYETVKHRVCFKCVCANISSQTTELHYKFFTRATESGMSMAGCNFGNILPISVPKCYGEKKSVFWQETFKIIRIQLPGAWSLPFHYGYCWSHEHSHSRKTQSQRKLYQSQNVSKNGKIEIYLAKDGSGLAFFSADLGHIFGSNVGNEFGVMLSGKGPHKPEFAYDIVRIHSLMIYTDLIEYNIVGDTKGPLLRCLLFISKRKSGDIITTGQNMNHQIFSNLQFRPLLKNFFQSIHIDLRDASDEKILFVCVGITRLVLMFRKASNNHF